MTEERATTHETGSREKRASRSSAYGSPSPHTPHTPHTRLSAAVAPQAPAAAAATAAAATAAGGAGGGGAGGAGAGGGGDGAGAGAGAVRPLGRCVQVGAAQLDPGSDVDCDDGWDDQDIFRTDISTRFHQLTEHRPDLDTEVRSCVVYLPKRTFSKPPTQ